MEPGKSITFDDMVKYTKSRIASFKAPAYMAIVDELPRNHLGKVLKTELRKTHGGPVNEGVPVA